STRPAATHTYTLSLPDALPISMVGLDVPGLDSGLLIPVPLGRARLRTRGYNQSERLARALGRRWGRPVVDLLVRTRDTAAQTARSEEHTSELQSRFDLVCRLLL